MWVSQRVVMLFTLTEFLVCVGVTTCFIVFKREVNIIAGGSLTMPAWCFMLEERALPECLRKHRHSLGTSSFFTFATFMRIMASGYGFVAAMIRSINRMRIYNVVSPINVLLTLINLYTLLDTKCDNPSTLQNTYFYDHHRLPVTEYYDVGGRGIQYRDDSDEPPVACAHEEVITRRWGAQTYGALWSQMDSLVEANKSWLGAVGDVHDHTAEEMDHDAFDFEHSLDHLGEECNESISGQGFDYRGCQDKTMDGHTCQRWSLQHPREHRYDPAGLPGTGLGNHSYCRNPTLCYNTTEGVESCGGDTIWCYTLDGPRWEYCEPVPPPLLFGQTLWEQLYHELIGCLDDHGCSVVEARLYQQQVSGLEPGSVIRSDRFAICNQSLKTRPSPDPSPIVAGSAPGESYSVFFQKSMEHAMGPLLEHEHIEAANSEHCYYVKWGCFWPLVTLNFLSLPMFTIVTKFVINRCGDAFVVTQQFEVEFSSDEEGSVAWDPDTADFSRASGRTSVGESFAESFAAGQRPSAAGRKSGRRRASSRQGSTAGGEGIELGDMSFRRDTVNSTFMQDSVKGGRDSVDDGKSGSELFGWR